MEGLHRDKVLLKNSLQVHKNMKVIRFDAPGLPEVLTCGDGVRPKPGADEVVIKVAAAGVNVEDIWQRYGYCSLEHKSLILGHECSGWIFDTGANVTTFKLFDNVCAVVRAGGAYAEYVVVHASSVLHAPHAIDIVDAASLPQATALVTYCFEILSSITPQNSIMIHGAAGGVGVIATQYASSIGCKNIYAVVGTDEKMMLCRTLGATECINRKRENFCERVRTLTKDHGVDIILDVSGKDCFEKNLDCLAEGGCLFLIGLKSGSNVEIDFSLLKRKNLKIRGASLLGTPSQDLANLLNQAEGILWPLIAKGLVKPVVRIFPFSEAAAAHRAMENHSVSGKILLVPDDEYKSFFMRTS